MPSSEGPPSTALPISETTPSKPEQAHTNEKRESLSSNEDDIEKQAPATEGNALQRQQSEIEYPPTRTVVLVMISLLLALFLVSLDRTIMATAIPKMTDEFHSLDDIGWYGSAFMLTSCCFQLLLGRVYTFYTPKYVFLTVIGLFEVGSAICGAAPNSVAFIIGRAIQGVGSAGIMSGAVILMLGILPLAKRPKYMGFFGAVFGVSSVVGPLLGGAFTTNVSWRWCFYINLPIGAVAMTIMMFILKPTEPTRKGLTLRQQFTQLDPLGNLFLLPSIVCMLLALQWGGATYAWSDGRIIALWVLFAVLFIAFVAVEYFKQDTAMIPASVIKNRSLISAVWFTFSLASGMMILVYYLPIWFQAIKGVSAVKSGIDTIPLVLSLVIGSIGAGQIVGRIGYYTPLAIASSVIMPIGAGLISTWKADTGHAMWIGYQVLFGFGLGLGMQQGNMAAQTVLARKDVPIGVSLCFFAQMLGGAIFVSVGQNVFQSALVDGLTSTVRDLSPVMIVNTGATDLRNILPPEDLPIVLNVYNHALRQVFLVAVGMGCVGAIGAWTLEWKSVKGKKGASGPPQGKPAEQEKVKA